MEKVTPVESGEKVSRDQVLSAYKKLAGKAGDPAELDENDPEVISAEKLYEMWEARLSNETMSDGDAQLRHNFEKTMLFVDAGFHDPDYLEDVLDWLFQDANEASKNKENPSRIALRKDIAKAIKKVKSLLNSITIQKKR